MYRQANDYEVIVLGSGLGGLIAGTLLAKKRHSVLLLKEKAYQTSYHRDGYQFSPFSNFSEKRLRPSLLRGISRELGLSFLNGNSEGDTLEEKDSEKKRGKVPFQVILPKSRIDLFDDPSLSRMEWKREFPTEIPQAEAFYDELGLIQGLLKTRNQQETSSFFPVDRRPFLRKWLSFSSLPNDRTDERLSSFSWEFKKFIQFQLISWGNLFSDSFPVALAAYLLLHKERGNWVSSMDLEGVERELLDCFVQSGGEIEEIERAERAEKRWRKGFTLTLEGDRRAFQGKYLILNAPLHSFRDLLRKEGTSLSRWLETIHPRYFLVPCFFGIREKVVPVGMRDLLVSILDPEKPYEEGNVLFLSLSPRGNERMAPEGCRALTVQSLAPFRSWNGVSSAHRESVMNHLTHLIPFLEPYLDLSEFEWAGQQTGHWSYPHYLYEINGPLRWREGVVPTRLSRNLYFIGKENFPHLGLEGEVLGGLMVAQQMLKKFS
jgi:phytoene dehydrogenase-like protein